MGWVINTYRVVFKSGGEYTENVQEGDINKPVPLPQPDGWEVCEKEQEDERAAGVAVFLGVASATFCGSRNAVQDRSALQLLLIGQWPKGSNPYVCTRINF